MLKHFTRTVMFFFFFACILLPAVSAEPKELPDGFGLYMGDESALHASDGQFFGTQRFVVVGTDIQAVYL